MHSRGLEMLWIAYKVFSMNLGGNRLWVLLYKVVSAQVVSAQVFFSRVVNSFTFLAYRTKNIRPKCFLVHAQTVLWSVRSLCNFAAWVLVAETTCMIETTRYPELKSLRTELVCCFSILQYLSATVLIVPTIHLADLKVRTLSDTQKIKYFSSSTFVRSSPSTFLSDSEVF